MSKFLCIFLLVIGAVFVQSNDESNDLTDARIIGGQDVDIRDFPYQVGILYGSIIFCGGAIYSQRIILTAAHCIFDVDKKFLTVVVGVTSLSKRKLKYPIKKTVVHEDYKNHEFHNDIGFIVLQRLLAFSDSIQPIALAETRAPPDTKVIVTGWGQTRTADSSDTLKMAEVLIVDYKDCIKAYPRSINNKMICAAVPDGSKDSCQGDSGGPLAFDKKLIGLVSFGKQCGSKYSPGVYTSIPDYLSWILSNVAKE